MVAKTKIKYAKQIKGYVNVIKNGYNLRIAPSKRAASVDKLNDGEVYAWLGETEKGWYKVLYAGTICYIAQRAAIAHEIEEQPIVLTVTKEEAKVYASPSSRSELVSTLKKGAQIVNLCEKKGTWIKVLCGFNVGWISAKAV